MTRLGLLGGTFDPIHLGHLDAASTAREALDLERVLLVTSKVPPHRHAGPAASACHRFAMTAMAAMTRDGLVASDVELERGGPSYTSVTLRTLADAGHPPLQLFFICGADAFAEIATWHDYPAVLDRAHFVVVSRPGHPTPALEARLSAFAPRMQTVSPGLALGTGRPSILRLEARTADVSSTDLRRRIAGDKSIAGLTPPDVERYIRRHGLYRPAEGLHDD